MSEHLKTLEVYNISTIPKLRLPLSVLFAASFDVQDAENLFQHLRTSLRELFSPLLLPHFKPMSYMIVVIIITHKHLTVGIRCLLLAPITSAAAVKAKPFLGAMSAVRCHP